MQRQDLDFSYLSLEFFILSLASINLPRRVNSDDFVGQKLFVNNLVHNKTT